MDGTHGLHTVGEIIEIILPQVAERIKQQS